MSKRISKQTLKKLLAWFWEVREEYFFREERNPYRVWVSEVVLQQTRIQAALKPLQRFFHHFPDVASLANASEEKVVYEFRGLGYYSRARNLRKGALYLTENFSGKLPKTYDELLQVPSIGPYTAAAIASICFDLPHPVCDGNVKRVLLRVNKWPLVPRDPQTDKKCIQQLQKLYKGLPAGDTNEAIMELGQKICTRSKPKCGDCPISEYCKAYAEDVVNDYPMKAQKPPKVDVNWHIFIVKRGEDILLQRWNDFYFLKKQVAFPSLLEFPQDGMQKCSWSDSKHSVSQLIKKYEAQPLKTLKHGITKHRISIFPHVISSKTWEKNTNKNTLLWTPQQQVPEYLVSSALNKIWKSFANSENLHDENT
ncbi:A/G-specific adenine glycosylase [Candidatus Uabimicrobium amorphum]|uniref:Adenine DNA glycosylase n=1 Tax=Uabimicrobium amorphum TaxID=2596890 RepID=A0A5S9IR92_UABAM|nr:A/G-specific adenine glycosylase [Candidatus Uabimicrobium amorphum]BBM86110.1 A/G-specific adenine glycosylase [Candidatus Uabimicrobium amorphum]